MDATADLILERQVPLTAAALWAGWTEPDLLMQWFTPAPWKTVACRIDLHPGGQFHTVMQGPDGQQNAGTGCFLVTDAPHRLVWTTTLGPGFRPNAPQYGVPQFSCELTFTPQGDGTLYRARAIHGTAAEAKIHADMGFEMGWGAALDQLVALMRTA